MKQAWCQLWLENEEGWGQRPDGYSLHQTVEDRIDYLKTYWKGMPDDVPYKYSRSAGQPFPVQVDDELFEKLAEHKGLRFFGRYQPKAGDTIEEEPKIPSR